MFSSLSQTPQDTLNRKRNNILVSMNPVQPDAFPAPPTTHLLALAKINENALRSATMIASYYAFTTLTHWVFAKH